MKTITNIIYPAFALTAFACFMLSGSAQADTQDSWRFCNKCHAMFYNGYPDKGRCAGGGGHVAQGYNFVLRYRGNLENDVQLNPVPHEN